MAEGMDEDGGRYGWTNSKMNGLWKMLKGIVGQIFQCTDGRILEYTAGTKLSMDRHDTCHNEPFAVALSCSHHSIPGVKCTKLLCRSQHRKACS